MTKITLIELRCYAIIDPCRHAAARAADAKRSAAHKCIFQLRQIALLCAYPRIHGNAPLYTQNNAIATI